MARENPYLDAETLARLVDELYDEVCVYDGNYRMVYINKACQRHYGFTPEELIGKRLDLFEHDKWWDVSILPHVYRDKRPYAIHQTTAVGSDLFTVAVPIMDGAGEIQYVVMSVRDQISENLVYAMHGAKTLEEEPQQDGRVQLLYESQAMQDVLAQVERIAPIDSNCLLVGESGTGKTHLAKYIHQNGPRRDRPFVSVNCASLPKELIESELFGYAKGAFTGARSEGRKGLFETANGGTLLLDEISELPYSAQAKLLHVLQEKEFLPVGATVPVQVDVKIVAATNKDLVKLIESQEFRADLYYRLDIFELVIPSLRQRTRDIPKLAGYFLNEFDRKYGKAHVFTPEAMKILLSYEWKGNVRELRHLVEKLTVMVDDLFIRPSHLPKHLFAVTSAPEEAGSALEGDLDGRLTELERRLVLEAYRRCRTTRKVAQALDISQTRASKLIRKYVQIGR